jgi:hypothetical protein
MQKLLSLALVAALLAGHAQAQTRPAARPAAKAPMKRTAAPAAKPAAKPAPVALAAAPAARPAAPVTPEPLAKTLSLKAVADRSFGKGSNALNLGIGFGLGYNYGYGSRNTTQTPAMSLSYMHGVATAGPGTISVGGVLGYKSITWKDGDDKATWRNIYVGARGAFHYGFHNPKLDTYAGLGLGVRVVSYTDNIDYVGINTRNTASESQAELSSFIGARYFFTDKIGAFTEMGYDMSYLKLGLSARF